MTPAAVLVGGIVGALLLSACATPGAQIGSDPDGGGAPIATVSAGPTSSAPSTTISPGRTIAEEDEPGPVTEMPTGAADEFGVAFPGPDWIRPDGTVADTRNAVNLIAGADHCDWGRVSFLHVPWPLDVEVRDSRDVRQFAWDPTGQLEELGITRDREVSDVPADAAATGFRTAHQQLWLGDDADEFAYLVGDDDVVRRLERPVVRPAGVLACA